MSFLLSRRSALATTLSLSSALVLAAGPTPAYAAVTGSTTWTQLSPSAQPSARYYAAMAYDGVGHLVLFGGFTDGVGFLSDTWVWDGSTWTNKNPAHHPSARDGAAMLYDSVSQSVILFGGENGSSFADTWSWDGNDWTQRTPSNSPPRRAWAGMAASPTDSTPILFGGLDATGLNDTWSWHGSTNNWVAVNTAHSPTARSDFVMALDTVRNKIVVFGGGLWNGQNLTSQYGDTWTFDGTDWTQVATSGPHARINPNAAFDPRVGGMLLFGGFDNDSSTYYQDSWSWTGSAWTLLSTVASPTKRDSGVMAYLPSAGKTVIFGGFDANNTNLGDTWALTMSAATSAPVVSTQTSATRTFAVSWGAPGAVTNYYVQYAHRTKNSSGVWVDGAWQQWKVVGPTTHSASLEGVAGNTYLFRARAVYADGSTTGYSPSVSTVVPFDDRSGTAVFSSGWKHRSMSGRYNGTTTETTVAGKTMSFKSAAHAFFLIGDKCAKCGKLKVFIDGALVKTVDTHASSTKLRQMLYSRTFAGTKTHTIKIKSLGTAGRPRVSIDAIGVQR